MNWQRWLAGVVMVAAAGPAAAPLALLVHVASAVVNANLPASGIVPANNDASDGMPNPTVPGQVYLPCSSALNPDWGCDDAAARGLRQDRGAPGDLYGNQAAPGSPYARNGSGSPASRSSADDQSAGPIRNVAGSAPQFIQWPTALGASPPGTAAAYSIHDGQNAGQDQGGAIAPGIDPGSLPADNGPTTIDDLPCTASCYDVPVATNGSPSAVAEPATLSLLGLGMLAFAGLRRRHR